MAESEVNEALRSCYSVEQNDEAFSCLKDAVRSFAGREDVCRPRLVLFTHPRCSSCQEEKAAHQKEIQEGIIEEIDLSTEEGRAIARQNDIGFVPALVVLDCNNRLVSPSD